MDHNEIIVKSEVFNPYEVSNFTDRNFNNTSEQIIKSELLLKYEIFDPVSYEETNHYILQNQLKVERTEKKNPENNEDLLFDSAYDKELYDLTIFVENQQNQLKVELTEKKNPENNEDLLFDSAYDKELCDLTIFVENQLKTEETKRQYRKIEDEMFDPAYDKELCALTYIAEIEYFGSCCSTCCSNHV